MAIIKDGRDPRRGRARRAGRGRGRATAWPGATRPARPHERETDDPTALLHELTGAALARGERLEDLAVTRPSLEDVYLELTADGVTHASRSTWRQYRLERRCSGATRRAAFFNFLFPLILLGAVRRDLRPASRTTST